MPKTDVRAAGPNEECHPAKLNGIIAVIIVFSGLSRSVELLCEFLIIVVPDVQADLEPVLATGIGF